MVDFEEATEIARDFLRSHGHTYLRLETVVPKEDGWNFHFDVGVISKNVMVVSVGKDGEVKSLGPWVMQIAIGPGVVSEFSREKKTVVIETENGKVRLTFAEWKQVSEVYNKWVLSLGKEALEVVEKAVRG